MLRLVKEYLKMMMKAGVFIFLALPASTNYKLGAYSFGAGGVGDATSTNYRLNGVAGELSGQQGSSTNYKIGPGLNNTQQADVPPAPAFSNPSNYYNKLLFIVDPGPNPTDAKYAIAISSDNFVTTQYIQDDNTVNNVLGLEDYQTYTDWGSGTGEYVVGLQPATTYQIKVKAIQGKFTETGYGPTASAATTSPSITVTLTGVSSGTVTEGVTTDITSTSNSVPFGTLALNTKTEAASTVTVSTNAASGYTASVRENNDLKTPDNNTMLDVSGTNASPGVWPTTVNRSAYGYHSSDSSLGAGTVNRFNPDNSYAQFDTTAREIAYNNGPITGDITTLIYAIQIGRGQVPGNYSHLVTLTASGIF